MSHRSVTPVDARHATVPTLNCVWAACVSPAVSTTVADTSNWNDGSPERSAVGDASGTNATVNAPSASVTVSPVAKEPLSSSFPRSSPQSQLHQWE